MDHTTSSIADYYKANAQRTTQRAALGERNIRVLGDTAIDSGTLTFFEMRNGQATTTVQLYTGNNCGATSGDPVPDQLYTKSVSSGTTASVTTTNTTYTVSVTASVSWLVTFTSTDSNVGGSSSKRIAF